MYMKFRSHVTCLPSLKLRYEIYSLDIVIFVVCMTSALSQNPRHFDFICTPQLSFSRVEHANLERIYLEARSYCMRSINVSFVCAQHEAVSSLSLCAHSSEKKGDSLCVYVVMLHHCSSTAFDSSRPKKNIWRIVINVKILPWNILSVSCCMFCIPLM